MDGIPMLMKKTKLKSFGLASNLCNVFKDLSNVDSSPSQLPVVDEIQKITVATKRTRNELTDDIDSERDPADNKSSKQEQLSKRYKNEQAVVSSNKIELKMASPEKPAFKYEAVPALKKRTFGNDNYRRLNMKGFKGKFKGKSGSFQSKGAKYKRFLWSKNKNRGNFAKNNRNEDDSNINQNFIVEPIDEEMNELNMLNGQASNGCADNMNPESSEAIFKKFCETTNASETKKKTTKPKKTTKITKAVEKIKKAKKEKTKASPKQTKVKKKSSEKQTKKGKSRKIETAKSIEDHDNETDEPIQQVLVQEDTSSGQQDENEAVAKIEENQEEADDIAIDESNVDYGDMKLMSGESTYQLPKSAYKLLESVFGYKTFKPHQEEAIARIARGHSTLVILATGHGKSLIYQLAAKMYAQQYPGSVVLVISPLISLMQDQLFNLPRSIRAAMCDAQMTPTDFQKMIDDLNKGKINILFMSPEALISKKVKFIPRLAFVCIDEVHCLSQWSHNFRPSYLQLCDMLRDYYKAKCILGLTATATDQSIEEIRSYFDIDKHNIIKDCDLPSNLIISVSKDINKDRALISLLRSKAFEKFGQHVIIYCSRREQTEKLAQYLRSVLSMDYNNMAMPIEQRIEKYKLNKRSLKESKSAKDACISEFNIAEAYHAGLSAHQRKRIQNQFISGKLKIIVATMAFGMGINMKTIRAVIHYNMPKSIENYVQEIGRAGRDLKTSHCHLFLETQREDINEIKRFVHMNGYDQLTIKKLVHKIFDVCTCATNSKSNRHHVALPIAELVDTLDIKEETILTLLCYMQSAGYVTMLPNCFSRCTLKSYKGRTYLNELANSAELLAIILKSRPVGNESTTGDSAEFTVDLIDLCEQTNGDYETIVRKLKNLQWNIDNMGNYKSKTGISLQFFDSSFYMRRKCIADMEELDVINDFLWTRVSNQMTLSYANFKTLYRVLSESAFETINGLNYFMNDNDKSDNEATKETSYMDDPNNEINKKSNQLKSKLNDYFNNRLDEKEFTVDYNYDYEKRQFVGGTQVNMNLSETEMKRVVSDIRKFIFTYESEIKLTGQIIAKIFHGIPSPRYPAEVWGRVRQYWRSHLDVDYEHLIRIATNELLKC